jgi:NADP-dependent 3-hydroxy acid dehydrogenase YdfG
MLQSGSVKPWAGRLSAFQQMLPTRDAVERAASQLENAFGPVDVWINDAMISVFSPVKEMDASDYKRVTEVLYLGFVHGTLAALRRMLPRNCRTIIQIGSALSYRSIPLQSAYCACNHAINGFTDSLRCELHHDKRNVKITTIQMPAMNTTQFDWVKNRMPDMIQPVPPIYEPEIAAEVVYAAGVAKKPRREYWVGMPTVLAIVGQKFIPRLLDIYLGDTGYKGQQLQVIPRTQMLLITSTTLCPGDIARAANSTIAPREPARRFSSLYIVTGLPWEQCWRWRASLPCIPLGEDECKKPQALKQARSWRQQLPRCRLSARSPPFSVVCFGICRTRRPLLCSIQTKSPARKSRIRLVFPMPYWG